MIPNPYATRQETPLLLRATNCPLSAKPGTADAPRSGRVYRRHMELTPRLQPLAIHVLTFLRDLEEGGGGYVRRGAPGWTHPHDVQRETGQAVPEVLPRLHRCSLADRDDARPPALRRPVWIYRIHERGKRWLGAREGQPGSDVARCASDEPDASIWLTPRARIALAEMRRAAEDLRPSKYVPREHGWRTSGELEESARTHVAGPYRTVFDTPLLESMILAGLAERRRVSVPWRGRPVVLYRVTAAGGVAIVLQWRDPAPPPRGPEARPHPPRAQ